MLDLDQFVARAVARSEWDRDRLLERRYDLDETARLLEETDASRIALEPEGPA